MGLLVRLRERVRRDRLPTELFVPAPAFPAYQPGLFTPDFVRAGADVPDALRLRFEPPSPG
ncbi:hypothetical protein ACIA5D_08750 [Actinoplanes sp. NPDC051513]|uniref:hypothetical protein n=1 Tax=Actinoplanes sp. NPDC051513 TaxID=3363908 RepID=UPI00379A7DEE